ncbi:MAG: M28 family metallopeptidase [Bryobacteraceae bacterium]
MRQIRPEAIRAHMRFLADDLLEGRGTGTRGYELAAKYVASQFEGLGLQPGGTNGTYFQVVRLRRMELVPGQSSMTLVRDGREEPLAFERDFAMGGSAVYPDTSVRAPAVFVGFGVEAPDLGYNDYTSVDVRGKIVVMLYGAPARFPSAERAHYSGIAKTEAAVGVITLWMGAVAEHFPFPRIVDHLKNPSFRWLDAQQRPNDSFPEIRGGALLGPEGARKLFAGATKSLDQAVADGAASKPQAFVLPLTVSIHTVTRHIPVESPNVAAVLQGSDSKLRDEYVVYTAHVDHMGIGLPVDGDSIYNGAVDNASGTAALIEVARAFTSLPRPPRRSVLFVAVTGEEAGLIGSDYFAHNPTVSRRSLVADLNMDGISLFYDFRDIVALGEEHSSLGKIVRQAASQMDLEVSPDPMPEEVFFIRSDQYSFVRQGVPSVAIGEGFKTADPKIDGKKMALEWEAKLYHTPKDDMNQPLNFIAAVRCTRVNFLAGYLTAQADQRPVWNAGDFFGKMFGDNRGPAQ